MCEIVPHVKMETIEKFLNLPGLSYPEKNIDNFLKTFKTFPATPFKLS